MIAGTITNLRPHIELFVEGPAGDGKFEFTIDTGYSGTLTLPPEICATLQLTQKNSIPSQLADGNWIKVPSYTLIVEWDGRELEVEILAIGEEPLVGARMLIGKELCLNYTTNTLTIKAT